jgi:hypothetical protein
MNTIENILGTVNTTQENLTKVENQLFEVFVTPIPKHDFVTPLSKIIKVKQSKENFQVFKDCGKELSVMKSQFVPMQPREFYDNIISTVHEFGADLDLSTLTFKEYCDSKKIEFSIRMKPFTFINNRKVKDETNLEVTFSTSYDGSKSNTISLYTERVVCSNGMVASKLEGNLKGRNILSGKANILSYASELAQIINGANEFGIKMQALDKKKLNKAEIEEFKKRLFGFNKASLMANEKDARANGRSFGILESFDVAMFNTNIEFDFATKELLNEYKNSPEYKTDLTAFKTKDYISMTAFEVLQSVTHYTNHIAKIKSDTNESLRFGTGYKTNTKAQEILFELVEA